ncbi:MAG: MATE family efflux transporter [Saprospiraceae bacterium]|nr:MATE family efflux transporter [Saprospiraceae bacterium]
MKVKEFIKLFGQAVRGEEVDYTKGSINRALILLSVPMILEMVMEALFAIVDVFLVAKISNNAVATVGITEGILMLVESIALGIAMAATAMISRRIGEKNNNAASRAAGQAILFTAAISLVLGILAFIFAEDILLLMGGDAALIEEGKEYTRIILSFNFILMFLFVFNGIFRAAGNPAIAMRTLIFANLLNIILDPILIFGLGPISGMGVTGAAVATCIGRGSGVLYQLYILFSDKSILRIKPSYFKPDFKIISRLFRLTLGGAGQFLISTASWIFLIRILSTFGSVVLAGYTIGLRIIIFSILPSWGLANATATLVGQNLGAKEPGRAEKTVWKAGIYNMLFLLFISIIFIGFGKSICGIFSQSSEVIQEASLCLIVLSLGYIFFAYEMTITQAFNGAGDTTTPTILTFIFMWLVQIPLAYILAIEFSFGSLGVYMSISISGCLMSIAAIYLFRKGKWKEVII